MTLTANAIINIYNAFHALSKEELDLNTACIIASNINKLTAPKDIIEKKRESIIMKYAEKDSDGNLVKLDESNIKIADISSFRKDMDHLLNEETNVEIQVISKKLLTTIRISPQDVLPFIQNNLLTE